MNQAENILKHFGVKGMRWGLRRTPAEIHGDHAVADAARKKAKKHGTKALSNKELQDLITRANLEQQYSRLVPPSHGARIAKAGGKVAGDILLNFGKQQAGAALNANASKIFSKVVKTK